MIYPFDGGCNIPAGAVTRFESNFFGVDDPPVADGSSSSSIYLEGG